ncbi:MAG: AAC(3) family N-acetyltransferase [Armatimonadota bacterium]
MVTIEDIRRAVREYGLSGKALCVHSSLKSFGRVEGGARTIVDGLLAEGCTVMVPTFTSAFWAMPDRAKRYRRNAWNYDALINTWKCDRVYTPDTNELDEVFMGALPEAVLHTEGRIRGNHPINSFAAVGPLAEELISGQNRMDVYSPFDALVKAGGYIVLMGVGLTRMTFIHYAEQVSGRKLFIRWANTPEGRSTEAQVGGCSEGFDQLEPAVRHLMRETKVGNSDWKIFPAEATLQTLVQAISANPQITHCDDPVCGRCDDTIAGGPVPDA